MIRKVSKSRWLKVFLVAFLLTIFLFVWLKAHWTEKTITLSKPSSTIASAQPRVAATVVKVVDGDTVQVKVGEKIETIRLIGIDAPESVDPKKPVQCFAKEASNKAKELLTDKSIWLEMDSSQGDSDIYKRELRYIFLPDGNNFSEMMIAGGFAREYDYYGKPYKYRDEFKQAQIKAKENKVGLWGKCK